MIHTQKKFFSGFLARLFFILVLLVSPIPLHANSDLISEKIQKDFLTFFSKDAKYALELHLTEQELPKSLSSELMADVEYALLSVTDFQIQLQLQDKLETIWERSIEFNETVFNDLYSQSSFDRLIIVEMTPKKEAIGLTLRVINLGPENFGLLLFSSGEIVVPVDWDLQNVATINASEIAEIRAELEHLKNQFSVIENAESFAEHLHNARIHLANKNRAAAIQSYEKALIFKDRYADVLDEYYQLVLQRFGAGRVEKYLERKVFPTISDASQAYLELNYAEYNANRLEEISRDFGAEFPPILSKIAWTQLPLLELKKPVNPSVPTTYYRNLHLTLETIRAAISSYEQGVVQTFFIDINKAAGAVRYPELQAQENNLNSVEFVKFQMLLPLETASHAFIVPPLCSQLRALEADIFDPEFENSEVNGQSADYKVLTERFGKEGLAVIVDALEAIADGKKIAHSEQSAESILKYLNEAQSICSNMGGVLGISNSENTPELLDGTQFCETGASNLQLTITPLHASGLDRVPDNRIELTELPVTIERDRVVFAKSKCSSYHTYKDQQQFLHYEKFGDSSYSFVRGFGSLLITDNVDKTKPILVDFVKYKENSSEQDRFATIDITKDGTYFPTFGLPLEQRYKQGHFFLRKFENSWLFIPGIIQSSIAFDEILRVSYYNLEGKLRTQETMTRVGSKHFSNFQVLRTEYSNGLTAGMLREGPIYSKKYQFGTRGGMARSMLGPVVNPDTSAAELVSIYFKSDAAKFCTFYEGAVREKHDACLKNWLGTQIWFEFDDEIKPLTDEYKRSVELTPVKANCTTGEFDSGYSKDRLSGWGFGEENGCEWVTQFYEEAYTYWNGSADTSSASGQYINEESFKLLCPKRYEAIMAEQYSSETSAAEVLMRQLHKLLRARVAGSYDPVVTSEQFGNLISVLHRKGLLSNPAQCRYSKEINTAVSKAFDELARRTGNTSIIHAHLVTKKFDKVVEAIGNSLPDNLGNSQQGSDRVKGVAVSEIEKIFNSETIGNRRYLQESLKNLGLYQSSIDGSWGKGTEAAFRKLFDYLDKYYPNRKYVSDFGFDDGRITRDEFVDFWNGMYSCDPGKLLSKTSACGN